MEPRKEVKQFADAMEHQLKLNDFKGGWKKEDQEYFIERIEEKINDLDFDMKTEDEKRKIAADIANYAMMIFDTTVSDF